MVRWRPEDDGNWQAEMLSSSTGTITGSMRRHRTSENSVGGDLSKPVEVELAAPRAEQSQLMSRMSTAWLRPEGLGLRV